MKRKLLCIALLFTVSAVPSFAQTFGQESAPPDYVVWQPWEPGQKTIFYGPGTVLNMPQGTWYYQDNGWQLMAQEEVSGFLNRKWEPLTGFITDTSNNPITPIPEPEIYAMLAVGLGLLGWMKRGKK